MIQNYFEINVILLFAKSLSGLYKLRDEWEYNPYFDTQIQATGFKEDSRNAKFRN